MVGLSWISNWGYLQHWEEFLRTQAVGDFSSSGHQLQDREAPVHVVSAFIDWAIRSNKIDPVQFGAQLKASTSLPLVRSDFFNAPPDLLFWDAVREDGPWAPGFFPLAAWDDLLLVGTCFPDITLPTNRKIRLVLCQPTDLLAHSKKFLPVGETSSEPTPSAPATDPDPHLESNPNEQFDPTSILLHPVDDDHQIEGSESEPVSEQDGAHAVEDLAAPQGLILNFESQFDSEPPRQAEPCFPPPPDREAPIVAQKPEPVAEEAQPVAQTAPPLEQEAPPVAQNPPPVGQDASPVTTESYKLSQDQLSKLFAVPLNKLEPIHLDECRNIDMLAAQALLQTCITFEGAMILLNKSSDTGVEQLVPWKWNDLLLSVKRNQVDPIDLTTASLFSIVQKTNKPFHGPVTDSNVSNKFFNDFFRGQKPAHVTLVPLVVESKLIGMLLGSTNGRIENRQSLRLMERLAAHFSRRFAQIRATGNARPFPLTAA